MTTEQPTSVTPATTAPAARSDRRSLSALAKALVAIVLALASLTLPAPSASAAGGAAPDLRFCLRYNSGSAYASKPAYLYAWDAGAQTWRHVRTGSTASNGCGTWTDVSPNRYYYVQGYWHYWVGSSCTYYNGNTNSAWVGNVYDGLYGAGTGYIGGPYRCY